ncbi:two-component system sensor histidine kinase KdpD [Onishia taeanensis]|uniref:histidine kinase n=1 Tax=Onishia taeanensis TaxID=284577 RepID=A0A328XL61_9GAMM|nr:sensor histidine kinase KdpD [Halomonas taeanensis]RAR59509.1 two-component system sensor histidine kinase KdpD [Halomonas taeanensis]
MSSDAERRPDPDALLKQTARREARGSLRVFLGAAPGVGKTYTMLCAARERASAGDDVVIGIAESHGRVQTEALCEGLPRLPLAQLTHHGRTFEEFDLDAALARHPRILLVDELAHRNIPGSRHSRRYQDIEELLDAGIDVWTTVNVQHIESLNDAVARITSVRMRETVPDALLERARDISLVDLTPDELLERLRQGKVYVPEQARAAMDGYFSEPNLNALRELALQTMAERVDSDVRDAMGASAKPGPWPVRPHLLVALSGGSEDAALIRAAHRLAERRRATWRAVYVDRGHDAPERRLATEQAFALVSRLGGEARRLYGQDRLQELLDYARQHNVTTLMVGRSRPSGWRFWRRPLARRLLTSGGVFDLVVVAEAERRPRWYPRHRPFHVSFPASAIAFGSTLAFLGLALSVENWLSLADLSLLFLGAVLVSAALAGTGAAMLSALLGFLAFNFFFTEPRLTLVMVEQDQLLTVVFFLAVAVTVGQLAGRGRRRLLALRESRDQTHRLLEYVQALSVATDYESVRQVGLKTLERWLNVPVAFLQRTPGANGVQVSQAEPASVLLSDTALHAAGWSWQHAKPSGKGTDTLSGQGWRLVPLVERGAVLGVIALALEQRDTTLSLEEEALLTTLLSQLAMALVRTRLVEDLGAARLSEENERLRSALLASVSHDLRTPLSSIIGSASTLRELEAQLTDTDRHELLDGILGESERLNRYIQNLLDMTRLGHGTLKIERDWVALDDLLAAAVKRLGAQLEGLELVRHWPHDLPLLYVHPALIEQALVNILDNAVRFSPKKGRLNITAGVQDEWLWIRIIDQGPGIPAERREEVFDMFFTGGEGDRGRHGSGLGLAICRGMVGAHGGQIRALPSPTGEGTCIEVRLPIEPNDMEGSDG